MIGGKRFNIAGAIILWRGAIMKPEWLDPYVQNIGNQVNLPGNNSCSRDPIVAIGFALDKQIEGSIPVLFVVSS